MDENINTSPAIKRLPSEVQALIRSGNIITNASQCVIELALNAIDARATKVAVRINFKYHKIQVADNGFGMNVEELGLIGERFMTSKCHSLNDLEGNLSHYGFRGEALASLKECSGLLTLESRPEGSETTYAKVYAHGKTHSSGISRNSRPSCGTTVTVHDFMYNMPVRRARIQPDFEIEEIKCSLESIALIHPEVSFSLHNEINRQVLMQTHKSSDIVGAFSQLFNKTLARSLMPVEYSMGLYSVNGYIGKETHNRKNLQFIYVNKRLVLKTKLHKIANTVLGLSFLLRQNAPSREVPALRDYTTEQWLFFSPPDRDRHAVYIFNIICPHSEYDICLDPKKTLIEFKDWNSVLQCLENAINVFLQKECNTFASQEKRNLQSKIENKSLLAEVSQLDKEYALGKHSKFSQESNRTEHREDSFMVNKPDILLPGIHKIFGAVCGAQAKRKRLSNKGSDSKSPSKSTEGQQKKSQSSLVLLQESSTLQRKSLSYKDIRDEQESATIPLCSKGLILDHSKTADTINKKMPTADKNKITCGAHYLKLNSTDINMVETISVAEMNLDKSTEEPLIHPTVKSINIEDGINSTCPIVKFRRMYGNCKNSKKEEEIISNAQQNKRHYLEKHIQEETAALAHPVSKIKQILNKNLIKNDDSKHSSKHISAISSSVQNIHQSISGISECFSEKTVADNKSEMHPIQRFRLLATKKLSHKVQNPSENPNHTTPETHRTTNSVTECKVQKPKSKCKQTSWQSISTTKTSMSICSINHTKANGNKQLENATEHVPENVESVTKKYLCRSSVFSEGKQDSVWRETNKKTTTEGPNQVAKDIVFKRPLQLGRVKCCKNTNLKCYCPLKEVHPYCPCNSRLRKQHQKASLNPKTASLPLWSLSYVNKRKSGLQALSSRKKMVHFQENALCNNDLQGLSKTAFNETRGKYLTSSDFIHTIDIKKYWKDAILKDQNIINLEQIENTNKNTPFLLDSNLEYNFIKDFPGNWRLKAESHTLNFTNNKEHTFSSNLSFTFSPKLGIYYQPVTLAEMFPKKEFTLKGSNIDENIVKAFSTDIMKHYTSIINPSSGNEADLDTTTSLKTCCVAFLSNMAHPSSEKDVSAASEAVNETYKQQIPEQINEHDNYKDEDINFCSWELPRNEIAETHQSTSTLLQHDKTSTRVEALLAVQNDEKNSVESEESVPESANRLEDTCAGFLKPADNVSVSSHITVPAPTGIDSLADSQVLRNRSFSSPDVDISLLLSQRVSEKCSKDNHQSSSKMSVTSNCVSPVMSNSSASSDVNLIHTRSKVHSKNAVISETSSSEIIDATPKAITLSNEFSLHEVYNKENAISNVEVSDPDKQTEEESGTTESDKMDEVHKEVIFDTNEKQSNSNRCSDQERKRCSNDDLSGLYGKRFSLEKSLLESSGGCNLSGCTEILIEALDILTNNLHSCNQESFDATNSLEREAGGKQLQKRPDNCEQKQEFHNTISLNNLQLSTIGDTQREDKKGLAPNSAQRTSNEKVISNETANINDKKTNDEPSCPEEWEKRIDSTGRPFFIHKESGMPSFYMPSTFAGASYSMSERYGFLPKGLSPILKGKCNNLSKEQDILTPNTRHAFHDALIQDHTDAMDQLKHVKWREIQDFEDSGCKDLLKTFVEDSELSMQFCEKDIPRTNVKELPKFYNALFSYTFTKETFATLKVLGQLDRKFIVVITMCEENKVPRYIVLFDQHAVHERIRVEQLMQEYQEEDSDTTFKTSSIDPAITLSLGKDDIRILQSFKNDFENLGVRCELMDDSTVKVSSVPTCLYMREVRECKNNGASILKSLLESLIREQIDCLVATRGSAARVPKTLQAVISSEACKGALKFGDELTTEECRILLTSLSSCKLPFHCAHGRPALTPVADLEHLYIHQKPVNKAPDLQKLKKLLAE